MPTEPKPRPLLQRLLWFAALWLGGVGTVALISFCLAVMPLARDVVSAALITVASSGAPARLASLDTTNIELIDIARIRETS